VTAGGAPLTAQARTERVLRLPVRGDVVLGVAGLVAGLAWAVAMVATLRPDESDLVYPLGLSIGWAFVGSGLLVRGAGAGDRLGSVLVLTGIAFFAGGLQLSGDAVLFTFGTLADSWFLLGIAYLLLSFPAGHLETRFERRLFACGLFLVTGWQLLWLTLADTDAQLESGGPDNLLLVHRSDDLAELVVQAQRGAALFLTGVTAALLVRKYRAASPPMRRVAAPVLLAGAAFFLVCLVKVAHDMFDEPLGDWPEWLLITLVAVVPVAFTIGLLRQRLARGNIASLMVELGSATPSGDLRDALARALGDPTLQVAYALPDARHVDRRGHAVELPDDDAGHALTPVVHEGEQIAVLVHDPAIGRDPALVESVTAAAALALTNERLEAELRARLDELAASRTRIVEAADAERRRIERNLHDGAQQRLVSIAMALGLAEARLADDATDAGPLVREARESLLAALEELRELGRGIHPPVLSERGLAEALGELSYRSRVPVALDVDLPRRLPEAVEAAAYYVAAEALANVARHAGAKRVELTAVRRSGRLVLEVRDDGRGGADTDGGSGLRGLADRVEALNGTLRVESPPGAGTRLVAELPCG
jgi:signal transduction histidine kinase